MPSLGFLKKKRTRESQPDHSATSHPPSPITPAPTSGSLKSESGAYFAHQKQQSTGGSSTSTPSGQARVSSGGTGHSILQHLQHHLHPGGGSSSNNNSSSSHGNSNPPASNAQPQPQQAQQEVQPAQDQQQQQRPSSTTAAEGASSSSTAAGVTGSSATTTSTTATATAAAGTSATTSPATTAATTPALSGGKDSQQQQQPQNAQQSLSSANNLGNPPHQHDGAPSARPSSNSNTDASPFSPASTPASLLGPPISPLPSASPGTDPALLQQQQQAARPAPPHPDAMQTDQPVQAQNQPQTQLQQQHNDQAQQQQLSSNQAGAAAGSQARVTKGKYSLVDFDILRTLGTGSFGRVHLVQSNHNSRYYAIKVLKKAQVVKMKQVEHTNDERRMLSDVKHPFLITLWGTFQDWKNLYMVMDFVEGGELFSLLRKSGRFPNPVAKFYAAEVTLALEYLHSKNIIYRDLKPENLLLDRHGHLKITDFGFAKRVPDKTWTLCGTPDYLAPEVVSNKGYNKSVDWWSLGILIYEMLCGYTPFWDSGSPMRIYENILKGKVKYPAYIVPEAQNLLERLITADLTKRLGNLYGGSSDVKSHPWFAEVTWDRLARKDIDAPYTPPVKAGSGDASQFDKYPEEHEKYGVAGGNDDYGHLFTEF